MDTLHVIILALVQGLTEFLPISSSAHLILVPTLFGFADQGLAFDVAVHIGSLSAVIAYFRRDLREMLHDFMHSLGTGGNSNENSRMVWMIILATIPVVLFGALFKGVVESSLRSIVVIIITTIAFAVLLYWADVKGKRQRDELTLSWRDALIIGLFQAVAIIPGTSRSGITITAALLLGLSRKAASRFSFLLSIPTIFMSGIYVTYGLISNGEQVIWGDLILGVMLSFVAAYLCIHMFLSFIERVGMLPFVIYRLILGAALIFIAAS